LSDDTMIGPGMHEMAAQNTDNPADASVHAMLAIASAINRLADAVNDLLQLSSRTRTETGPKPLRLGLGPLLERREFCVGKVWR
jgi:hypothetical protein